MLKQNLKKHIEIDYTDTTAPRDGALKSIICF